MVRVVTLNIWQEQGPWQERLALICDQLRSIQADLLCLQEVREVPGSVPNQAATLADSMGMEHRFEPVQEWGGGVEGLAILSRFPVVDYAMRELPFTKGRSRRVCLGIKVSAPEGLVWVFTTHLAYRLQDGALRERQVREMDEFVRELQQETPSILCGDFNATPPSDEIRFLKGLTSIDGIRTYYQDAFEICNPGVEGFTWAKSNPGTAKLEWLHPNRRLDYVFVTSERKNGTGKIHSCRLAFTEPNSKGVFCSDHYGLVAEISISGQ